MSREPSPRYLVLIGLALVAGVALRPVLAVEKAVRSGATGHERPARIAPPEPKPQPSEVSPVEPVA